MARREDWQASEQNSLTREWKITEGRWWEKMIKLCFQRYQLALGGRVDLEKPSHLHQRYEYFSQIEGEIEDEEHHTNYRKFFVKWDNREKREERREKRKSNLPVRSSWSDVLSAS
jgi:hypothetical protein